MLFSGTSSIYQQQQQQHRQFTADTRREAARTSSPNPNSRPTSACSTTSQWPIASDTYMPPRQETWTTEVYVKRSTTPTWTELGTESSRQNPTWDRQQSSCYQRPARSPLNSSWSSDYATSKRPSSTSGSTSTTSWSDVTVGYQQQRRGSLQLWQFLVALLDDPANAPCIAWTGRGMEFKLIEPEEVCISKKSNIQFLSAGLLTLNIDVYRWLEDGAFRRIVRP